MTARILLIEDEESLVVTLVDALQAEGHEVEYSVNGSDGFELASRKNFDVIVLDIMLPEKTGFDICRDLRARGVQTPILILPARGQLVDKILGFRLRCTPGWISDRADGAPPSRTASLLASRVTSCASSSRPARTTASPGCRSSRSA